jgi:26S proteasome regulatory subunit N2
LSENTSFPERQLASYLCAKIQYHLDNFGEALNYALQSGNHWNPDSNDKFNQCLVKHCIDEYRNTGKASEDRIRLIRHILD